ncbi:TPA: RNA-binding protein [Streptococcus suis]|nr:RNA-binding protein [Streptococcus suis]
MVHEMLLAPKPFEMMKSGQKTIELRLYDEKRKHIQIGDRIRFYCTENQTQTIEVQVLDLHIFDNFAQLYKELDLLSCGYTQSSIRGAKPEDMEDYYSREQLEQYGAVGIELRVIDSILHSVFFLA